MHIFSFLFFFLSEGQGKDVMKTGTNTISGFQTNQGRVGSTFGNQGGAEDRVGDEMFTL